MHVWVKTCMPSLFSVSFVSCDAIYTYSVTWCGKQHGKRGSLFLNPHPRIDHRERGRQREREEGKNQCDRETLIGCLQIPALTGDQSCSLGVRPHWGSNLQPFGAWMTLQPTEPPSQGPHTISNLFLFHNRYFYKICYILLCDKGSVSKTREIFKNPRSYCPRKVCRTTGYTTFSSQDWVLPTHHTLNSAFENPPENPGAAETRPPLPAFQTPAGNLPQYLLA